MNIRNVIKCKFLGSFVGVEIIIKKNMFSSIHYQRWLKWIASPKKFIVNLEIKVGSNYTFKDVEVVARFKSEAFEKAKKQVRDELKIIVKGSKSLGKVKQFNEF